MTDKCKCGRKSGKWLEVPDETMRMFNEKGMNRKERRDFLRENGKFKKGRESYPPHEGREGEEELTHA